MFKKSLLTLFVAFSVDSFAASFDCNKVGSWVEYEVCKNPSLSRLDELLADTYNNALKTNSNSGDIKSSQVAWLKESRNKCTNSDCLSLVYTARINELYPLTLKVDPKMKTYRRFIGAKPDIHNSIIEITETQSGRVKIQGNSIWVGNEKTGNVNAGEISGEFQLVNNEIRYFDNEENKSEGCQLLIRIAKDSLVVSDDNGMCGGFNVEFDGFYKLMK